MDTALSSIKEVVRTREPVNGREALSVPLYNGTKIPTADEKIIRKMCIWACLVGKGLMAAVVMDWIKEVI